MYVYCVFLTLIPFYRGRATHPGAVIALCDNPIDANKVNVDVSFGMNHLIIYLFIVCFCLVVDCIRMWFTCPVGLEIQIRRDTMGCCGSSEVNSMAL